MCTYRTLARCGRASTAVLAVAVVLTATALVSTVRAAAQDLPPAPPVVAPEPIDPDAVAAVQWSVPKRYDTSWRAWSAGRAKYDADVITPRRWSIILDACGSRAVRSIERYTFVVTGITLPTYKRTFDGKPCKRTMHHVLPGLGWYRVEVTVHTALGASVTLPRIVELRDYLIVSLGDSLSSGEGVPDQRGQTSRTKAPGHYEDAPLVHWKDRRCHRSARSGPALAAKAIENASRHTSVTFVSFACSGAELKHLYHTSYGGAEPGRIDLPPQIDAVRDLVGPGAANGERQIDALLVTGGINDLHFSTIVRACASNRNSRVGHTDCVTGFAASKLVGKPRFAGRYDALANALRPLHAREIYVSGYPSQVFHGGGCGQLGIAGIGIDAAEGEEMNTLGIALNHQLEAATMRHREEGWNFIEDLTEPFRTHAYCAHDRWFNRYEDSLANQGDIRGTAHPNRIGHRAFARLLGRAIVPNQPSTPFREITLTIDAVKLVAVGTGLSRNIDMTLWRYPRDPTGVTRWLSVPRNGQWTPVPPELGTFAVPVFLEPASPRHARAIELVLDHRLPIHHRFADGYGSGSHDLVHPTGDIAVRYHIDVRSPTDGPQECSRTGRC